MKTLCFCLALLGCSVLLQAQDSQIFKKARDFEQKNNPQKAIEFYKIFLNESNKTTLFDQIQLKIARLSPDFETKIAEYRYFLERFSNSKYYFIGLYEMGMLLFMNNDLSGAKKVFLQLADLSRNTPYWQKAMITAAEVEFKEGNYNEALLHLYKVLEEIYDYEDISTIYFLIGAIMEKRDNFEEALEYYLICAGSFNSSCKAPSALLQLTAYYLDRGEKGKARYLAGIVQERYPDSPASQEARRLTLGITAKKEPVALIDLNNSPERQQDIMARLKKDLKESHLLTDSQTAPSGTTVTSGNGGFYIQLGFYSSAANARALVEKLEAAGISGATYREVVRQGKSFYKVLIGPFRSYENARMELKSINEKNFDAIIVELSDSYE